MTSKIVLRRPRRFGDSRGWFMETYQEAAFRELGIADRFVQDNHSLSISVGTVRGLHFQTPPHAQSKIVRCIRGRIFDVAVDIRQGSPTYGRWIGTELSAETGAMLYIPIGFAHGFMTMEPSTEVVYKVCAGYSPQHSGGLLWNDQAIGIDWPVPPGATPILSPKDEENILLSAFESPFPYDGIPLELIDASEGA